MSRKIAGSRLDEVTELFSMYFIFLATLGPVVCSGSNRNAYQNQRNDASVEYSTAGAQG
jgi:hypothetical protein